MSETPKDQSPEMITAVPGVSEPLGNVMMTAAVEYNPVSVEENTQQLWHGGKPLSIAPEDYRGDPSQVIGHPSHDNPAFVRRA